MANETFTPKAPLFISDYPKKTKLETIVSGAGVLVAGTVLGKITSGGKLITVNSAGTDDGRRAPYAVLAEDVDATSTDKVATVYLTGDFNKARLVFGGADTFATHEAALRDLGIFAGTVI